MVNEGAGYWYADIATAKIGDEYRYRIVNGDRAFLRIDPYARQVTSSIGNSVVHDPSFDWGEDQFHLPPVNELVIYEMHLGTFHVTKADCTNGFEETLQKLEYLKQLGVNAIELMPLAEFGGYTSWGYNPSCIFAVEESYGGPIALKRFVKAVHGAGKTCIKVGTFFFAEHLLAVFQALIRHLLMHLQKIHCVHYGARRRRRPVGPLPTSPFLGC
jgi:1,4-alpha-glucan branching enzyme